MAVADYAEWDVGPPPGELLLLRLVKFYEQGPEWFIGKDLAMLMRLMRVDSIAELMGRVRRLGHDKLSDDEQRMYQAIDRLREADPKRYHGPVS